MGLIGTFEGYVPIATDLYLRGNNIIGFKGYDQQNYKPVRFDAGQITILADGDTYHVMNGTFNTTGFNNLNFEIFHYSNFSGMFGPPRISIQQNGNVTLWADVDLNYTTGINKTLSINIANINIHTDFLIQFIGWHGNVYRVWLS